VSQLLISPWCCILLGPTSSHDLGPLLFSADQAPHYLPGIRAVLGIYCAIVVSIVAQVLVLWRSNKARQTQRIAHGKPQFIVDTSMSATYQQYAPEEDQVLGQNGALRLTTRMPLPVLHIVQPCLG
jgi:hypothetical protein